MTASGELEMLLHYMPIIVRGSTVNDWERQFCASIIARSRRARFAPSQKQISVMRRLVDRFKDDALRDDVIDGEADERG